MSAILQDLRYALRMLVKSPGISVIAVLSLGLGIGATGAAFSLIETIRLRGLPYPQADRLIALGEGSPKRPPEERTSARHSTYLAWEKTLRSVSPLAAHTNLGTDLVVGSEPPVLLGGEAVSANLFELLGVRPSIGRSFRPEEDRPGASPVVMICDDLWRTRFHGSPGVIGRVVELSGVPHTIIGVMPPGMRYEFQSDFWIPLTQYVHSMAALGRISEAGNARVRLLGRLVPGMSLAQARAELAVSAIPAPPGQERWIPFARPLRQDMLRFWRSYDLAFGAVALAVLLIACANLAGLLLVRTISRQREFAVRGALGASPARIALQLLSEGMVLAGAGGIVGMLLAGWGAATMRSLRPTLGPLPTAVESGLGTAALPISAVLTLLTAVLVSLAPAYRFSRAVPQRFLRGSAVGQSGQGARRRSQHLFVALQIAGAVILVSLAGMGAQAYLRFSARDVGLDSNRIVYAQFRLPDPVGGRRSDESYAIVRERLLGIPGIEAVGVQFRDVAVLQRIGGEAPALTIARSDGISEVSGARMSAFAVDSGYFAALAIPFLQGRTFSDQDTASGPPVAIVNALAARRWWPGEDPVGKRFKFGKPADPAPWTTVVGVVENAKEADPISIVEDFRPTAFLPVHQGIGSWVEVVLRPRGPGSESFIAAVRKVLYQVAPDRSAMVTTQRALYRYVLDPMHRNVVGIFAAAFCGLLLSAIGIYGVLAYAVERRKQEIGVRLALGAGRASVVSLVLREGLLLAFVGLGAGFAAALAVIRLLQGVFFGGLEIDFATLAGVGGVFLVVTLLASAVPVRRALRVDPIVALRSE
jgi:putative ABC transport system permease protein